MQEVTAYLVRLAIVAFVTGLSPLLAGLGAHQSSRPRNLLAAAETPISAIALAMAPTAHCLVPHLSSTTSPYGNLDDARTADAPCLNVVPTTKLLVDNMQSLSFARSPRARRL